MTCKRGRPCKREVERPFDDGKIHISEEAFMKTIDSLSKAVKEREALREKAAMKWISVKDKPPVHPCLYWDGENQVNVSRSIGTLTLSDGTTAYLANIDVLDFLLAMGDGTPPDDCTKILYWMPLPEPPEVSE